MEGEQPEVIELDTAIEPKKEIAHKQELKNHIDWNLVIYIFVAFPRVFQRADIELRGADKFGFLAPIALQYGRYIVPWKAQSYREEAQE